MQELIYSKTPKMHQFTQISHSASNSIAIKDSNSIHQLVKQFNKIDKQIQISQSNMMNFLINVESKGSSKKNSANIKLKMLENAAEMNRAQFEMKNREMNHHFKYQKRRNTQLKKINYMEIYRQYLKDKQNEKNKQDNIQTEEDFQQNQIIKQKLKQSKIKLKYTKDLKNHTKIFNYILDKSNSFKEIQNKNKNQQWRSERDKIKKFNKINLSQQFTDICREEKQSRLPANDPQEVINSQLPRFYSQKSTHKINSSLLKSARCSMMVQKQNDILKSTEKISKDNTNKLKIRFAGIVNDMGKMEQKILRKQQKRTNRYYDNK